MGGGDSGFFAGMRKALLLIPVVFVLLLVLVFVSSWWETTQEEKRRVEANARQADLLAKREEENRRSALEHLDERIIKVEQALAAGDLTGARNRLDLLRSVSQDPRLAVLHDRLRPLEDAAGAEARRAEAQRRREQEVVTEREMASTLAREAAEQRQAERPQPQFNGAPYVATSDDPNIVRAMCSDYSGPQWQRCVACASSRVGYFNGCAVMCAQQTSGAEPAMEQCFTSCGRDAKHQVDRCVAGP